MPEKKRIVLIEDNEADGLLVEKALDATHRPFETSRFSDGAAALLVLLATQPARTFRMRFCWI